jgi:hypothetical protein
MSSEFSITFQGKKKIAGPLTVPNGIITPASGWLYK